MLTMHVAQPAGSALDDGSAPTVTAHMTVAIKITLPSPQQSQSIGTQGLESTAKH